MIGIGTVSEPPAGAGRLLQRGAGRPSTWARSSTRRRPSFNYENLGIGRLIYQLPTTLCEIFLTEVFKKNSIDSLDQETLFTINKFFENNLNVSETSRKLFVHRNTLVYRLEKIKKLTGLDLRRV
ncbi:MAG: PucR family transcriptional regulator [Oscillospiraceae bacterium]